MNKKEKLSYLEGWVSIVINILLFGLKYWVGIITNSVAIIADAWHTLSDSISSLIVLIGVKVANKPADKEHPFGHGRAELIASLIIGVFLAIIAYNFFYNSIIRLLHREIANYSKIAILITIISIVAKEGLAQFAFWASKKTDSSTLKADGWHHRSDAISSIIILVGIFFGQKFWWVDGSLGILVALMIAYATYEIFRETSNQLLGIIPEPALIKKIKDICETYDVDASEAHHFHLHDYGLHHELTFHIRFDSETKIDTAHKIVSKIENNIRTNLNLETTIHIEPKS